MLFSRFFKLVLLTILVVLTSCHSSHEQSFQQLESALVSWYYKYHPTIANEKYITIYNNQIEKNDINSIEEYKADINRFMIELSQIDERKLNKNTLINYVATNQFLFQKYNDILNFNESSYNPKYFLKNLYSSLLFISSTSGSLNIEDQTNFILPLLASFPNYISNIKKNIIYYSEHDIQKSLDMIFSIEILLNNLPLQINSNNETLDEIDKKIIEVKRSLAQLNQYLRNIDKDNVVDYNKMLSDYFKYNKNIQFNLDYKFLINKLHKNMLSIALPIYKTNNDEPVWVDKEDTLKIIHSILYESLKEYPEKSEVLMSLDESLSRINLFSRSLLGVSDIKKTLTFVDSEVIYLEDNILYEVRNKNKKGTLEFLLNKNHYHEYDLLNKFNKYELDLYNIANYFPGKHFQIKETQKKINSISNIFINKYTNSGWGLLSQYFFIDKGYGGSDGDIYMLVHLKNVLNAILKNMIFINYYIDGKTKLEIENKIYNLTLYEKKDIIKIMSEAINYPLESNFEIIGYLKLKELYHNFGEGNLSKFYSILIKNAHLSPDHIKEFKFQND